MSKIHLFFCNPLLDKGIAQNEEYALDNNISLEKANICTFTNVMNASSTNYDSYGRNYFDLVFTYLLNSNYVAPSISTGRYKFNGIFYPQLTIHGDYLVNKESNKSILISGQLIDKFGEDIGKDYDYEYISHKRMGKVKIMNSELTYLINGKLHVYDGISFLKLQIKHS
jgi:hypothetical protein